MIGHPVECKFLGQWHRGTIAPETLDLDPGFVDVRFGDEKTGLRLWSFHAATEVREITRGKRDGS